jgi:hypothetical protein
MNRISLKTAKKLKEAGWNKKVIFYYIQGYGNHVFHGKMEGFVEKDFEGKPQRKYERSGKLTYRDRFSCPLAEEILAKLPKERIRISYVFKEYYCAYDKHYSDFIFYSEKPEYYVAHRSLSEALALLWIELKQKGLIK